MSIFQGFLTQQWAILAKSLRDGGMTSISDGNSLGKATSLPGGNFRPICSSFCRLEGAVNRSLTLAVTDLAHRRDDPRRIDDRCLFEVGGIGQRHVLVAHAQNRRVEVIETVFHADRHDFRGD